MQIGGSIQKLCKQPNTNIMMAYNLESSALNLHKKRCKKMSGKLKSHCKLRKRLPTHIEINYKYNIIQNLSFSGRLEELKYVICGKNQILVVMLPGTTLPVSGLYNLKLICGTVNILGYDMDSEEHTVFSNEVDGIMDITCTNGVTLSKKLINVFIENRVQHTLYEKLKTIFQNQPICLLLVRRNRSMLSTIIRNTKYSSFCQNIQKVQNSPVMAVFQLNANVRPLLRRASEHVGILDIPKSWRKYVNNLSQTLNKDNPSQPCIVICGGRNTGKSTLVKYLCNSFLSQHTNVISVAILDCDPLRPELSSPGNLSLSVFSVPILGPASLGYQSMSFSFKREIILSSPTPFNCLSEYFGIIKSLRETSKQFNVPIIVNTMGYKKSLQLEIIVNLLRIINPTHVLQVDREDDINSLEINLSQKIVNSQPNLCDCSTELRYNYHKLKAYSLVEKPGMSSEKLLSYNVLSSMVLSQGSLNSAFNAKNSMKCIDVSCNDYAIHASIEGVQSSYTLEACHMKLVALCEVSPKHMIESDNNSLKHIRDTNRLWNIDSVFHGYGLVLKVDVDRQKLTVLISSQTNLDPVNAIIHVGFPMSKGCAKLLFKNFFNQDKLPAEECRLISTNIGSLLCTSSKEFSSLSRLIFSNCLENMKMGLIQLYIWRSRVSEVPIGVELTISLLAAQITIKESNLDEEYKHILIHGDICRFVNMLCKSYNEDMVEDENSIASISTLINICPVIVEFRNFMTHMTTYIDWEISHRLIEKGMQWVKENYWKGKLSNTKKTVNRKAPDEEKPITEHINTTNKKIKLDNKAKESEQIQLSNGSEEIEGKFNSAHLVKMPIKHFLSMLNVKRPLFSTDTNFKFEGFMLNIMTLYIRHPEEVMDIIVKEMFLEPNRIHDKPDKRCNCGCCLAVKLVSHMRPVFEAFTFVENNVSNHFLETFIARSRNCKSVFGQWFIVFLRNRSETDVCPAHGSVAMNWFSNSIDWPDLEAHLRKSTHPWELRLAKRISS